ncbi:unnamed protein product [Trichobilharzia regenti]|nr:unnamed protein product [Trichobilharzia regenti]
MFPTKVTVRNNGQIQWVPPGLFHSICDIEVNWFPFDSQLPQRIQPPEELQYYLQNMQESRLKCTNQTSSNSKEAMVIHMLNPELCIMQREEVCSVIASKMGLICLKTG